MEDAKEQTLKQRKIALAQSEHAFTIVELMRDCTSQKPIIAKTEWETIVNALTLEIEANMMKNMVDYIESIRKGALHDEP